MYEAFYGLKERPFELVPNPRFLFLTPRQREALSNLQYGLDDGARPDADDRRGGHGQDDADAGGAG